MTSRLLCTLGAVTFLAMTTMLGCSQAPALPPTPNLYLQGSAAAMEEMPPDRRSVDVDIMYATDRMRVDTEDSKVQYYDERRSNSLVVGNVSLRLGRDLSWDQLLDESLTPGGPRIPVELVDVEELVRFPSSIPIPVRIDGKLTDSPEFVAERDAAQEAVRAELSRRLADSPRKDVFVYIHGVGNSFEDPMFRMAELWHFLGRPGVPVVYSWPAIKGGGPLRGYTYARESSEFTVYHLRQFLLAVASCPDVERIHILAHSRGTGVTLSVLRDLRLLHMSDAGSADRLKLHNIILAAPDIDLQIAQQRFRPDQVYEIIGRLTLYMTPEDKALGIAEFLFKSPERLGTLTDEDLSPEQVEALWDGRLSFDGIKVDVKDKGAHGHTYWIDNPAVLSDVILILRDDASPGRENGRPLLRSESGLWELYDGYPDEGPHAAGAD